MTPEKKDDLVDRANKFIGKTLPYRPNKKKNVDIECIFKGTNISSEKEANGKEVWKALALLVPKDKKDTKMYLESLELIVTFFEEWEKNLNTEP